MDRKEAEKIANLKACAILLDDYEVEAKEKGDSWVVTYVPKGRVRGGGFELTVSKQTREVTHVLRFQ